jgi:polysaccharide biosynthesis/export protein
MRDLQMMKRFLLLAALILPFGAVKAQNTGSGSTSERPRNTPGYFVDEIGLRMAAQLPFEGTVDPSTYIVGSMDLFTIEVKGSISTIWRGLAVNSQGILVIPNAGMAPVSGLTLQDAILRIQTVLATQYRSATIDIYLEVPKQVNVHVTGDVISPGRYVFPPQTRADIAVMPAILGAIAYRTSVQENEDDQDESSMASPAPVVRAVDLFSATTGTVPRQYNLRYVRIRRADGTETIADLLSYFYGGDISSNPFIQDGDVITVYRKSSTAPRISISGAVRMPIEFEYRPDDTVAGLLKLSGGLVEHADVHDVRVYRRSGSGTTVVQIGADSTTPLEPNDRVIVGSLQNLLGQNVSAWISGEVNTPGNYPIVEGQTSVHDLVRLADGTTPDALRAGAYLERNTQTIPSQGLRDNDQLWMRRSSDQLIEGIQYLAEEQFFSGRFIFIDLRDEQRTKELILVDGDRLFVPRDQNSVFVFGQVNLTGYYAHQPGMGADAYIRIAGGRALAADPQRVFIIKAGSRTWHEVGSVPIEPGDMVFVDRIPYETVLSKRQYELTLAQQRNNTYSLILSTVATLTSIITTAILISR